MKLVWIELDGYRRFDSHQRLHVDCRTVALLGPNEAGKTSVLRALLSLNGSNPFSVKGASQDLTSDMDFESDQAIIIARFLLEENDYEQISDVPEARLARWLLVEKLANGALNYRFDPSIKKDIKPRHRLVNDIRLSLSDFYKAPKVDAVSEDEVKEIEGANASLLSRFNDAVPDDELPFLSAESIKALKALNSELKSELRELSALIKFEQRSPPSEAASRLSGLVPQFVLFSEIDRDLKPLYDLNAYFGPQQQRADVPEALKNLASAAELSLEDLFTASQAKDEGHIETKLFHANEKLKREMLSAWNQSKIEIRFRLSGNRLAILVRSGESGFNAISERSDGLRQFVALFAFLSKSASSGRDVILLIDEVEIHLHYDAQADLVQMLAKQELAKKVIYTTHSLACLPEDLGLGIRFIQPSSEIGSKINNRFWSTGGSGLSPILFEMGAATMAFLPVRFCLLTEGPTDMILLPSLLREATGRAALSFQIAPGLSQAGKFEVALMQNNGSRILCLVDGDDGGKEVAKKLKRAGISESKILRLDEFFEGSCVIEDLVDRSVFVAAINEELRRSGETQKYDEHDLPNSLRPVAVDKWCESVGVKSPNKVDVAYQVLNQLDDRGILASDKKRNILALHEKIMSCFETASRVETSPP